MAKRVDWTRIMRPGLRGVAVEGKSDVDMLTAFLNAGEATGLWASWSTRLHFEYVEKNSNVIRDVEEAENGTLDVWGIVDRDWQSDAEIRALEARLPRLRVLPRVMIENYLINPNDLLQFLPPAKQTPAIKAQLDAELSGTVLDNWLQNGALWTVMHENNAEEFCRERSNGYPSRILAKPEKDSIIQVWLSNWHSQLDPAQIMENYHRKQQTFRTFSVQGQYNLGIYGKSFFVQVVVPLLNRLFGQQSEATWRSELYLEQPPTQCPADIQPILFKLLDF